MKKGITAVIFVVIILLIILIGDSIYAYVNKSIPIIHLKDKSKNIDKSLFFDVYHCGNNENKIVGKFSKNECSVVDKEKEEEPTTTTTKTTTTATTKTTMTTTKKISARKKAFLEEILNKYIEYGNVDKDNLKSFNIIQILNYGYYASKPEEMII